MKMKKKQFLVLFLIFLVLPLISKSASADLFVGGPMTGQRVAYYSASVTSYGYNSLFTQGRTSWDGISSKVQILYSPSVTNTTDRYYVGVTSNNDVLGLMTPYRSINGVVREAFTTEPWSYAAVSAYHNQIRNWNLSDPQIVSMVTSHEIGHSLGLAHAPAQVYSMMWGPSVVLRTHGPTTYDKEELIRKWGN